MIPNDVLFFGIVLFFIWIAAAAFMIGLFQLGKKSDINTIKAIIDTDDDELAANILELEEDNEQQEALRAWHKQEHKKHGKHYE